MRMTERLTALKHWFEKELCEGRMMKAPAQDFDISVVQECEPRCYLAWSPTRTDMTGQMQTDPINVCPGIVIMPNAASAKALDDRAGDLTRGIKRNAELGQQVSVSILFSVYEPGTRLQGFTESVEAGKVDLGLLKESTEEGLFTLMDWMDDCMEKLLATHGIPHTDLMLDEAKMSYSLYTDQEYVVDRRPLYYGFINATFHAYANEEPYSEIEELLK